MSEITKKSDEQKDAEAEVESFRKDLGPFVVAAETTRMAMLFTDAAKPDHPIIFVNDSFLSFSYSTGNTGESLRDDYADRPVLKKPFKYKELATVLAGLKFAPIER